MNQKRKRDPRIIKWVGFALLALVAVMGWRWIFARPSFDANKVSKAEVHMWQNYYSGNNAVLGLELISLLRNQYGLSLFEATKIGEQFASSAIKFHSARGHYEQIVLSDLTEAYRLIQRATGRSFNPEETARAELTWWVARRTPGQNSVEQVGEKIAELYALLFGKDPAAFRTAGVLRAKAARLRDGGGKDANWLRIE